MRKAKVVTQGCRCCRVPKSCLATYHKDIPINDPGPVILAGHCYFRPADKACGKADSKKLMAKFTHHIFVCCNQRSCDNPRGCCDPEGGEALRSRFKAEIKSRNLSPQVRANKAGCLDQCELGPAVVIYPQEIWYGGVRLEDVPRILDETIQEGRVLQDLLIENEMLNTKGKGAAQAADGSKS